MYHRRNDLIKVVCGLIFTNLTFRDEEEIRGTF